MSLLNLPIPHTISGLILAMETLHAPRGPYVTTYAPTNEPFVEILSTGPLVAGPRPGVFLTAEAAIRAFWLEFIKISAPSSGFKIYWRKKPSLDAHVATMDGVVKDIFLVTSCFVLSNKNPQSRDIEEECLGTKRRKSA